MGSTLICSVNESMPTFWTYIWKSLPLEARCADCAVLRWRGTLRYVSNESISSRALLHEPCYMCITNAFCYDNCTVSQSNATILVAYNSYHNLLLLTNSYETGPGKHKIIVQVLEERFVIFIYIFICFVLERGEEGFYICSLTTLAQNNGRARKLFCTPLEPKPPALLSTIMSTNIYSYIFCLMLMKHKHHVKAFNGYFGHAV